MTKELLEVGDKIYCSHYSKIRDIYEINRVTPKMAFVRVNDNYELKFKRDPSGTGYISKVGDNYYSSSSYYYCSAEKGKLIKKELHRTKMAYFLNDCNFTPLDFDTIETIYKLVKSKKT